MALPQVTYDGPQNTAHRPRPRPTALCPLPRPSALCPLPTATAHRPPLQAAASHEGRECQTVACGLKTAHQAALVF